MSILSWLLVRAMPPMSVARPLRRLLPQPVLAVLVRPVWAAAGDAGGEGSSAAIGEGVGSGDDI